jgi:hypothetical protein
VLLGIPEDGGRRHTSAGKDRTVEGTPPLTDSTTRGLWLAITVLTASLVGAGGALLAWAGGMNPPTALLTGGGAFMGTVLLVIKVLHFVTGVEE